jgi:hypothetical protein
MNVNPNSPLWSIYLWLLIHGGDPGPEGVIGKVLNAGILVQVASTVEDAQVRSAIQAEALRQFQSSFTREQVEQ